MLPLRRLALKTLTACALIATSLALHAGTAQAAPYVPGQVLVGYSGQPASTTNADVTTKTGITPAPVPSPAPGTQVLKVPSGVSVPQAVGWLRRQRGVAYAVPNFVAHTAGAWYPNDRGRSHQARGWEKLQWNFLPATGVNAPEAWANLIAAHRAGGSGVVVAILDTGVAYRKWHRYRRSPDFAGTHFVHPYDFVAHNRLPLDREGHGTFVTGIVAEATNNRIGLTGLAYHASIMPVRILAADGTGDAATIARGIRYAASHGAKVINLSLEFSLDVGAGDIPDILSAVRYAHQRGVLVVAAAGNEAATRVAYPARDPHVVSVGATTADRCLAAYSNAGARLDLVAPGGDGDAPLSDPSCHPNRNLPDIRQMTFNNPAKPKHFTLPDGWFGTSMSAPHVTAIAALVIASGVVGRRPSPDSVLARLKQTAIALGGAKPNGTYGYGLVDAGAATRPGSSPRHR